MKKLFLLCVLIVASVTMFGQPIAPQLNTGTTVYKDPPQMVDGFFKSYAPPTSIPPVKYTQKRARKTLPTVKLTEPIGKRDTLVTYLNVTFDYPIIEFPVDTTPKVAAVAPKPVMDTALLRNIFVPEHYRRTGMTKILSGVGLQAIAVGLVAYANTNVTSVHDVTVTHEVPYTYPVYELVNGVPTVTTSTTTTTAPPTTTTTSTSTSSSSTDVTVVPGRGPWWRPRPTVISTANNTNTSNTTTTTTVNNTTNVNVSVTTPNPTLNMHMENGIAKFTETHQVTEVKERNKTPYYVTGGIFAAAGVALEVLGIIDIHKANVYVTNNSVGFVFKF